MMRESTFNNVDFPAPLGPIIPITSPGITSKFTSWSAQIVSSRSPLRCRENGARKSLTSDSRKVSYRTNVGSRELMWNFLLMPSTLIMGFICVLNLPVSYLADLDELCKSLLHSPKIVCGIYQHDQRKGPRVSEREPRQFATEQRCAKRLYESGQRIQ